MVLIFSPFLQIWVPAFSQELNLYVDHSCLRFLLFSIFLRFNLYLHRLLFISLLLLYLRSLFFFLLHLREGELFLNVFDFLFALHTNINLL